MITLYQCRFIWRHWFVVFWCKNSNLHVLCFVFANLLFFWEKILSQGVNMKYHIQSRFNLSQFETNFKVVYQLFQWFREKKLRNHKNLSVFPKNLSFLKFLYLPKYVYQEWHFFPQTKVQTKSFQFDQRKNFCGFKLESYEIWGHPKKVVQRAF